MSHISGAGSGDHHVIDIHPGVGAAGAARMDTAPISRESGEAEGISDAYQTILKRSVFPDNLLTSSQVASLIFVLESGECLLPKDMMEQVLHACFSTDFDVETTAIAQLRSTARDNSGTKRIKTEYAEKCFDERYGVKVHDIIKQLEIDYPGYRLPSEILAAKLPQTHFVNLQYSQVRARLLQTGEAPRLYLDGIANLYFIPRDNLDQVSELTINNCRNLKALPSELGRAPITHLRCDWRPDPADEQSAEVLDKMQASFKRHKLYATLKFVMAVLCCIIVIGGVCGLIILAGQGIL